VELIEKERKMKVEAWKENGKRILEVKERKMKGMESMREEKREGK
jgi:hypothetical protein